MTITDISQQIKNKKRYSIFIDDKFAFGLDGVDLLYYKLQINDVLSTEKYNKIIRDTITISAKNKAITFLSYRSRSKKEIVDKLKDGENPFSDEVVQDVIEMLEKYGYIDDFKFATSFINDKVNLSHHGYIRLKIELKQKGVTEEITKKAYDELQIDDYQTALKALSKKDKLKNMIDQKQKNKVISFLQRKGFNFETIKFVLEDYYDNPICVE